MVNPEIEECEVPSLTPLELEAFKALHSITCECTGYREVHWYRCVLDACDQRSPPRISMRGLGRELLPKGSWKYMPLLLLERAGLMEHEETLEEATLTPVGMAALDLMRKHGTDPREWPWEGAG